MRTVLPTGDVARYCQTVHFAVGMWIKTGALRPHTAPGWHHGIRRDDFLTLLPSYRLPVLETMQGQARACLLVIAPDHTAVDMHTRTLHHVLLQGDVRTAPRHRRSQREEQWLKRQTATVRRWVIG